MIDHISKLLTKRGLAHEVFHEMGVICVTRNVFIHVEEYHMVVYEQREWHGAHSMHRRHNQMKLLMADLEVALARSV